MGNSSRGLVIHGERPFGIAFFPRGNCILRWQTLMSRRAHDASMTFLSVILGVFFNFDNGAGTAARQRSPGLVQTAVDATFLQ